MRAFRHESLRSDNHMTKTELAAWAAVLVTLLGIFSTVIGIWFQTRKQWLLHSANLVSELADQFTGDEWRVYRKHSAEALQRHRSGGSIDLSKDIPVLGFFENIGHLVRRKAIDKLMIWNKFGWYVTRYYLALTEDEDLIDDIRTKERDPTLWEELEWLNREMLKIYKKRKVERMQGKDNASRIAELFKQELNLEIR